MSMRRILRMIRTIRVMKMKMRIRMNLRMIKDKDDER